MNDFAFSPVVNFRAIFAYCATYICAKNDYILRATIIFAPQSRPSGRREIKTVLLKLLLRMCVCWQTEIYNVVRLALQLYFSLKKPFQNIAKNVYQTVSLDFFIFYEKFAAVVRPPPFNFKEEQRPNLDRRKQPVEDEEEAISKREKWPHSYKIRTCSNPLARF